MAKKKLPEVGTEIEIFIASEIKKFDYSKVYFTKMKKKYGSLEIKGVEDTPGYEAVRLALQVTRSTKSTIEKKRKEIKENSLKFGRAVDQEAARLVGLLLPLHGELQAKKDTIDLEKQKIKNRKKEEKENKIAVRAQSLMAMGMLFNGICYFYGDHKITTAELSVFDDSNFQIFHDKVQDEKNEAEAAAKAKKDMEELVHERVSYIKDNGLEKYITDAEKISTNYGSITEVNYLEFVEKLETREAEAKKEVQRYVDLREKRLKQLSPLLKYQNEYINTDTIEMWSQDIFNETIAGLEQSKYIAEENAKEAEKKEKAADKLAKENQAKAKELKIKEEKLKADQEARDKKIKAEKEAKEKKELAAATKKAAAALKPDKNKLIGLAAELRALKYPEMKTRLGKNLLEMAKEDLKKVIAFLEKP